MTSDPIRRAVRRALPRSETGPARIARLGAVDIDKLADDALLRNEQVAYILNIPLSTFHAFRKRPDFVRPVRIGCRTRWRWATVRAWIQAQERGA
jgi:predicted DNA-binding transcriptional regulator AlpA